MIDLRLNQAVAQQILLREMRVTQLRGLLDLAIEAERRNTKRKKELLDNILSFRREITALEMGLPIQT